MEATWEDKSPHHHQIEEVANIRKSYQWLENVAMKDSTEALAKVDGGVEKSRIKAHPQTLGAGTPEGDHGNIIRAKNSLDTGPSWSQASGRGPELDRTYKTSWGEQGGF